MKRTTFWLTAAVAVLLVAGCGQGKAPQAQPPAEQTETPGTSGQPAAEPEKTKQTITVYYSDDNLMEMIKEQQEIAYADDLDKYKQAITLLEKPKEKEHFPLWKDFHYHSVTFDKGTLTIDTDSKNVYNLGSSGEGMAIDALRETLFQFKEIEKIVILVDGKPTDSLMGHVSIDEPLTR
ncbi:GerMN domain-containing protein [Brevibacillus ruminantium]|uniref:GerMN domain-containing protein n=1 Tax=Brevibacillus ruminantium TaxID=2950604 RepID=A0ABY4WGS9_9BACL|nr:GerMN domain-containing protein [Brevibacillus ruminantium]USG66327.1 GerMN domain-containing protein [Brevibacillus ruminantium]